jgi:DNA-directed RNA polymerase specialized sigma24 family protein
VSNDEEARLRQLEDQFQVLEEERWFEGAVRKLEGAFSNRPEWVEDAVATAFERAVKRDRVFPSVDELKKWMYVVAYNDMRRRAKREAGRPLPPWEIERGDSRSAEDEALEDLYADELYVKWFNGPAARAP